MGERQLKAKENKKKTQEKFPTLLDEKFFTNLEKKFPTNLEKKSLNNLNDKFPTNLEKKFPTNLQQKKNNGPPPSQDQKTIQNVNMFSMTVQRSCNQHPYRRTE